MVSFSIPEATYILQSFSP